MELGQVTGKNRKKIPTEKCYYFFEYGSTHLPGLVMLCWWHADVRWDGNPIQKIDFKYSIIPVMYAYGVRWVLTKASSAEAGSFNKKRDENASSRL